MSILSTMSPLVYIWSFSHRFLLVRRCKCGNCCTELLQNPKECPCCVEIEACVEALDSDQVLHEVTTSPSCVTLHPGFRPVCLEIWSLRLAKNWQKKIWNERYRKQVCSNLLGKRILFLFRNLGMFLLSILIVDLLSPYPAGICEVFRTGNIYS